MTTARSILLPYDYAPAKLVGVRMQTCRDVEIGVLYIPKPPLDMGVYAEQVQRAMLAPPTPWERIKTEGPYGPIASRAVSLAVSVGLFAVALDVLWFRP